MIAPAMHGSMYNHLIIKENIKKLEDIGVEFIGPIFLEKKAKMMDIEGITARVIRKIGKQDFANKKVLIISGSTEESIDDVRLITNRSSGRIGIELARSAFERGADVQLWMGRSTENIPSYISSERFGCAGDLSKMVNKTDHDIVIVPAAISDYTIEKRKGKISSETLTLNLKRAPKIIESIRKRSNCYLVGFKAESSLSKDKLIERAYTRLKAVPMDLIVANDVKDVSIDKNHVFIINKNKEIIEIDGAKSIIAEKIFDKISKEIR
jgi:phosphopantothenoylcysteine decarboxylase/phosphopantothenate--cysteine ligase